MKYDVVIGPKLFFNYKVAVSEIIVSLYDFCI